jgi:hypothetical protein
VHRPALLQPVRADTSTPGGVANFWTAHRKFCYASSVLMDRMRRMFLAAVKDCASRLGVDVVTFEKGVRKDDVAHDYLAGFSGPEGLLFIGKAQEKCRVMATEKRTDQSGVACPWIVQTTRVVNQIDLYVLDDDFRPLFIELGSYFPYTGRACINGHEFIKRQLAKRSIAYEALDNGIHSCAEPVAL